MVAVSGCTIGQNLAQGGGGGYGEGRGIANVLSVTTTVSSSILILNQANGDGGAGSGGGAYNDATSTLALTADLVPLNKAGTGWATQQATGPRMDGYPGRLPRSCGSSERRFWSPPTRPASWCWSVMRGITSLENSFTVPDAVLADVSAALRAGRTDP